MWRPTCTIHVHHGRVNHFSLHRTHRAGTAVGEGGNGRWRAGARTVAEAEATVGEAGRTVAEVETTVREVGRGVNSRKCEYWKCEYPKV